MKKLPCGLSFGVLLVCCVLAWEMLSLLLAVRDSGRVLPQFTDLCITLRAVLIVLPAVATVFLAWSLARPERLARYGNGFVSAMMTALIVLVLPAMVTSFWLMTDPVRAATGAI